MYEIEFTSEALLDLQSLRKPEQQEVLTGIETNLRYEPARETRNRKPLRANAVADWELRLGKFRVFYNVAQEVLVVSIEAIGFKVGNLLFVRGTRRKL